MIQYLSEIDYKRKINYQFVGHDLATSFYLNLKDSPKLPLAYDIETAESGVEEDERDNLESVEITQIQFATDKFNAVIFPRFDPFYKSLTEKILQLENVKLSFNGWNFDSPILKANQVTGVDWSRDLDLMWMFKHYQPKLPRGLQPVSSLAGFPFPWKHLFGSQMDLYGGADVCSLHFILEWLPPLMKARGIWEGFVEQVYKFRGKALLPASELGLPVNEQKRIELKGNLIVIRDKKDKDLQENVPLELRNFTPKKKLKVRDSETGIESEIVKYGYEREPKAIISRALLAYNELTRIAEARGRRIKSFESFLELKYSLVKRQFKEIDLETGGEIEIDKWCKVQPFKASFDQLTRYIKWKREDLLKQAIALDPNVRLLKRGWYSSRLDNVQEILDLGEEYEVPTNHEGKETTAKGELEIFLEKTGDEVVQNSLEIRSLNTNINNYVANWEPSRKTGCIHTTWGFSAASGQIDSRQPNVLNVSKHTDTGQLFRRIVEAPEGWEFLEADKKSFHVATMGYVANDLTYIRFSQLDPHSIFTSYIMPKEWGKPIDFNMSDSEILERCNWIKKRCKQEKEKLGDRGVDLRQDVGKKTVLGNQLCLGPRKLWWQNRRSIDGIEHAKKLQATIADLFPKVENAKSFIMDLAEKQTYLKNDFGFIQWFYDVYNYRWDKKLNKWGRFQGEEARDAVAFAVQSPAFGMIKEENARILKRWREEKGIEYFPFRLSIHDSLIYLYRVEHREIMVELVEEEMNRPCRKLINEATGPEGLKVGVEWAIGRNWKKYDKESNPEGMKEG